MIHRIVFILIIFTIPFQVSTNAQKKQNYAISEIPDNLLKKAKAIIRYSSREFEIKSINNATYKIKKAITILKENADSYNELLVHYSDLEKVKSISAKIYNADGKLIKKMKKSEIKDYSYFSNFTLYHDIRVKYIKPYQNVYPYTVEYEYELEFNGLFAYPRWIPQYSSDISVQYSSFCVKTHNIVFRHKTLNLEGFPKISEGDKTKQYFWQIQNEGTFEPEPMSSSFLESVPYVLLAPNNFEIEGYKGNMNDWNSFGEWIHLLNKDRSELPENHVSEIKKMIGGVSDKKEIAQKLYSYLQNNTRYVSIQLGIGSWQPISAKEVAETGYGDCKALSNYMQALLRIFDIKSHYTLVKAGDDVSEIRVDFPSVQFNHAILCVPFDSDTVFLECTSQKSPFGYIGNFTDDRNVLIIDENKGKIVRTTAYSKHQNQQNRKASIVLSADGKATSKITTNYHGLQYDNISSLISKPDDEAKKALYERINIPSCKISSFDFSEEKDLIPSATHNLNMDIAKYATTLGKRMFVTLNMLNQKTYVPRKLEERKTDIMQDYAYFDIDTLVYAIPDGYKVEYIPKENEIQTDFGSYKISCSYENNQVTYIRKVEMNKNRFPADRYNDLIDFYSQMVKLDKEKMILLQE